jgi:Zn-dependent protease with chaperone function
MLYALFLVIAVLYNIKKFSKERTFFLNSLTQSTTKQHREMILSHHFHIFIFEAFLGFIISHLISEGAFAIGVLGFGLIYVVLLGFGLLLYQYFLKFIERSTGLEMRESFNQHVIKEFRVSFALILLPILLYSVLNWTFQNDPSADEKNSLWLLEFFTNIIFVSVLTISCTVIIMLRLLPNREITEPEYLEVINKRLALIGMPRLRMKWIETDIKNAFVVGIKLLSFSNQTIFIGKNLRTMLTIEEFDAVISHEFAHIANRHIHKRVIELFKNFISAFVGIGILMLLTISFFHLYFGEDVGLHESLVGFVCLIVMLGWMFFNYSLFFDIIRSHEYEADAYAVMKMGASLSSLKSALEKLSQTDEMPEYLKAKTKKNQRKRPVAKWFAKIFTTHPEISERMTSLERKISAGLPFNHYVSTPQKIRSSLAVFLEWKISLPLASLFVLVGIWGTYEVKKGIELVNFIEEKDPQSIINNNLITKNINSKPFLVGKSLMYYVVQKQNPLLIDHYLDHGANPGRTLIYLSESKNFDLFRAYYLGLAEKISRDEFYLILLRSADVNFNQGYRYLVNSPQFDSLDTGFKAELVKNHQQSSPERRPASIDKK